MKIDVQVPDGICGAWRVESFSISEEESKRSAMRFWRDEYVTPGDYKRLMRGNAVVMSNTPMEIRTNSEIIQQAKGDVLINGLGLGMVLTAILAKPEVGSVRVIEKNAEVIELVGPTFTDDTRVQIIHADCFDYKPASGERFSAVWHDIWDYICSDNLPEMKTLHRRYGRRADWQASWCRWKCEQYA